MVDDLLHTAVHEAGHAVIGRVLGLVCGEITLETPYGGLGHESDGDGVDQSRATQALCDARGVRGASYVGDDVWEKYEAKLRRKAGALVQQHRLDIERVAQALIERGTLTNEEIDQLLIELVAQTSPS
jgi:hypothetical protein